MTDKHGASLRDRACALRAEPAAQSQAEPLVPSAEQVIDLDRAFWDSLVEAAGQSNWIPPEYYANDWVSDCREFLRHGPALEPAPDGQFQRLDRELSHVLDNSLKHRTTGRDPKLNGYAYAEVPEWMLRQWQHLVRVAASGMSAGTAETPQEAQGEARQPGAGTADAQITPGDSNG